MTSATNPAQPGHPWPASLSLDLGGTAHLAGHAVRDLLASHGSPVYLLDVDHLITQARAWATAAGDGAVYYASKALPCGAVLDIVHRNGMRVDVSTEGELLAAVAAGVDGPSLELHGNAKSDAFLAAAAAAAVGTVIVDGVADCERFVAVAAATGWRPRVGIRIDTEVVTDTHKSVVTSGPDQKFGVGHRDADVGTIADLLAARGHRLRIVHSHSGSYVRDPQTLLDAAHVAVEVAARLMVAGHRIDEVNLGGGFPVPMLPGQPPPLAPADVYRPLTDLVRAALPDVRVSLEPGRAVVANAVIAAYEVMAVKRRPDGQVFVAVAGGMSDNPRPALYQSEYHALVDGRTGPSRPVTVVGHHCESGDVLIRSIDLPGDVAVGDCLLVAACGAYHLSMASNYNLTPRPALLAVTSTTVEVAVRRETVQEVLSRDSVVSRATHAGGALDRMAGHMSR